MLVCQVVTATELNAEGIAVGSTGPRMGVNRNAWATKSEDVGMATEDGHGVPCPYTFLPVRELR